MATTTKLRKGITEKQFDNGYWYAVEIKSFAKEIGIANSNKLRKDELEKLIKHYIRTGQVKNADRKNIVKSGTKDIDIGLTTSLPITHYSSNQQTKHFIKAEAEKLAPGLIIKSGVWYRLNRWRDDQITRNKKITYGDLIRQFVQLNQLERFEKVKVVRYINFLSEFLQKELNSTRQQAIAAWKKLKTMDIEKNYAAWKQHHLK